MDRFAPGDFLADEIVIYPRGFHGDIFLSEA